MNFQKNDLDEIYIRIAEECHNLLEKINEVFSEVLLDVEDDINWDRVEILSEFKNRLQNVLESPVPKKTHKCTE